MIQMFFTACAVGGFLRILPRPPPNVKPKIEKDFITKALGKSAPVEKRISQESTKLKNPGSNPGGGT